MFKKISLLLLAIVFIACTKEQLTPKRETNKVITGKILGFNGEPLDMAHLHVTIYGDKVKKFSIPTDKAGNYEIEYKNSDLKLSVSYTGVYHYQKDFEFYCNNLSEKTELNVKLKPYTFKPQKEGLQVIGNFNDFSFSKNTIPMELGEDGKYYALVPNKSDTLYYQIIGALPDRSINGTMSHGYVYDGGGDYRSFIVSKDSIIKIVFDPNKLQKEDFKSEIFSDDIAITELIDFRKYYNNVLREAYPVYERTESISKYFDYISEKLVEYYENQKDLNSIVKLDLIQKIFKHSFGYDIPEEIVNYYLETVPPTSSIQKDFINYTINALIKRKDENTKQYIVDLYEKNPDEDIRVNVLSNLVRNYHYNKDVKNKKKYYDLLLEKYPDSKITKNIIKSYSPDKKIQIGKMLPKFEIKNLDNENEIINNEFLKGKYWLIDIWATWCTPCIGEMKYLHKAHKKFAGDKFEILSISFDVKPEQVKEFRKGKWNMPWLHAFAEGAYNGKIGTVFEVSGIPQPMLIDPEGKIVELEPLRGELLIKTLKEYIK